MSAKDNDPKPRKTPPKARAKKQPESTDTSTVAAKAAKAPAPSRRRSAAAKTATSNATSKATSSVPNGSSDTSIGSLQDEVRVRAYQLYAERGYSSASPESDWFQAEREVAYRRQA
ncbi:MAG: DUF2934 domain-containing protein [Gemmatimonadaceae bacterium]